MRVASGLKKGFCAWVVFLFLLLVRDLFLLWVLLIGFGQLFWGGFFLGCLVFFFLVLACLLV